MPDVTPLTIWKFPLRLTDVQAIDMPASAEVLSAGNQFEDICLWARVDPTAPMAARMFAIVGTGHAAPPPHEARFIGTVIMSSGAFVWHVFERIGGNNAS